MTNATAAQDSDMNEKAPAHSLCGLHSALCTLQATKPRDSRRDKDISMGCLLPWWHQEPGLGGGRSNSGFHQQKYNMVHGFVGEAALTPLVSSYCTVLCKPLKPAGEAP